MEAIDFKSNLQPNGNQPTRNKGATDMAKPTMK
jgi:hypothetical protein